MKLNHLLFTFKRTAKLTTLASFTLLFGFALLPACSYESYQAKPIDQSKLPLSFKQRSLHDDAFGLFLTEQLGRSVSLPIERWDLTSLTHATHYFHPDLSVARAEWQLAQTNTQNAAYKPLPTVNGNIGHSNRANGDINPFTYSFSIDLPVVTHDKQAITIAGFQHLSNVAKLKLANTAWQLRQATASTFNALHSNAMHRDAIKKEIALKTEIVNMLEKRLAYGEASSLEVSRATYDLKLSQAKLAALAQQMPQLRAKLAKNIGLPTSATQDMRFDFTSMTLIAAQGSTIALPDLASLQASALLNHLAIRMGLEHYAISENKLKLAVAKQYPNLSISPGFAYEFGDHVWSLGFSSLMRLLNNGLDKNKAGIKTAESARALAAASFEQRQTQVLADTAVAHTQYQAALDNISTQQALLAGAKAALSRELSQFNAGMIDRLTLTLAKLQVVQVEQQLSHAISQRNIAVLAIENAIQKPVMPSSHP